MAGQKAESPLSRMRVAAPCQQSWDTMSGNDQVRFCSTCYKNVYKFSNLNRAQAIHLVTTHEGRACVAYYRRADGSIMAEECPVGLRRVQRPFKYAQMGLAVVLVPLLSFAGLIGISKLAGVPTQQGQGMVVRLRTMQPFTVIAEVLDPTPPTEDSPSTVPGYYPAPAISTAMLYNPMPAPPVPILKTPGYRMALRKPPAVAVPHPAASANAAAPTRQNMGHVAP